MGLSGIRGMASGGGGGGSTLLTSPGSRTLFVDGKRSDTYTADGSRYRPFKTITAAINQIITNGDNAYDASHGYIVKISNANYQERISLNNAALVNLAFIGDDNNTGTLTVVGDGVYGVESSTNNANLIQVVVQNLTLNGDLRLKGETNGTTFLSYEARFEGCHFLTVTNGFELTNLGGTSFKNCSVYQVSGGGTTVTNCNGVLFQDMINPIPVPLSLVQTAGNQPSGFAGNFVCLHNILAIFDATVDALSFLMLRNGTRLGSPGGSLNISGLFQAYSSYIRSDITINSGGTMNLRGSFYSGSLTNSGTATSDGKVVDQAYAASWSTDFTVPTKNSVYNKIEQISNDILFDHYVDAANANSSETTLYTDTLAAAQLSANGQKIIAQYGGVFAGSGTSTQQLRAYFGGTLVFDSGALSIGVATPSWDLKITAIRVSASVVRCSASLTTSSASLASYATYTEVTGLTLANTQILKITGTAGGVGGGSNEITAKEGYVEFKPIA